VAPGCVVLSNTSTDGNSAEQHVVCDLVVVATDGPTACHLIGDAVEREWARNRGEPSMRQSSKSSVPLPRDRGVTCVYFWFAGPPPMTDPILILNGNQTRVGSLDAGELVVNNVCFPSQVSSTYAPAGLTLASVTVCGLRSESDAELERQIKIQLSSWFDPAADVEARWRLLRTYRIAHAQPGQMFGPATTRPRGAPFEHVPEIEGLNGVFCCGDHWATPTLNGALESGRAAAKAVLRRYQPGRDRPGQNELQPPPVWEQWIAHELPQTLR
jgi:phytoene dehydrogenase-like protein